MYLNEKIDEILIKISPIYLKHVNNLNDAIRNMHIHSYDNIFFDSIKTINITSSAVGSEVTCDPFPRRGTRCEVEGGSGDLVYNYDLAFSGSCYVDIISDIKSDVICKFKYDSTHIFGVCDINDDFKIFNFLSPYSRKSLNFYLKNGEYPSEFKFTMRCYILSEKTKKDFFGNNIETDTHKYIKGCILDK